MEKWKVNNVLWDIPNNLDFCITHARVQHNTVIGEGIFSSTVKLIVSNADGNEIILTFESASIAAMIADALNDAADAMEESE